MFGTPNLYSIELSADLALVFPYRQFLLSKYQRSIAFGSLELWMLFIPQASFLLYLYYLQIKK